MKNHVIVIGHIEGIDTYISNNQYALSLICHSIKGMADNNDAKEYYSDVFRFEVPPKLDVDCYDNSMEVIYDLCETAIAKYGRPVAIIGIYEHTVLPAARLREKHDIRGATPFMVTICREKVAMREYLAKSGVAIPKYIYLENESSIDQLDAVFKNINKGLMLKPVSQCGALGISYYSSLVELKEYLKQGANLSGRLFVEEYIDAQIYHIDGVLLERELKLLSISAYEHSCFDVINKRKPLCSITIDDKALFKTLEDATRDILHALPFSDLVFHLELFVEPNNRIVFLEIACRFGGAGVRQVVSNALGVDLMEEALLVDMGLPSALSGKSIIRSVEGDSFGYLYVYPEKEGVTRVVNVVGLESFSKDVIWSKTPKQNDILTEDINGRWPNGGAFIFKTNTYFSARNLSQKIISSYRVECELYEKS